MTREEVKQMIASFGLPYAYHHFAEGEAPACPYVIFRFPNSKNFAADDSVFHKADNLDIELYTEKRDVSLEDELEEVLDANGLFYNKTENYLPSEGLYEILYELEACVWESR